MDWNYIYVLFSVIQASAQDSQYSFFANEAHKELMAIKADATKPVEKPQPDPIIPAKGVDEGKDAGGEVKRI